MAPTRQAAKIVGRTTGRPEFCERAAGFSDRSSRAAAAGDEGAPASGVLCASSIVSTLIQPLDADRCGKEPVVLVGDGMPGPTLTVGRSVGPSDELRCRRVSGCFTTSRRLSRSPGASDDAATSGSPLVTGRTATAPDRCRAHPTFSTRSTRSTRRMFTPRAGKCQGVTRRSSAIAMPMARARTRRRCAAANAVPELWVDCDLLTDAAHGRVSFVSTPS